MSPPLFKGILIELRPIEPGDAEALARYINDPGLTGRRYLPQGIPDALPLSRKQVESAVAEWADDKHGAHFAVALKESGEVIGHAECEWGWDSHAAGVSVVIAPAHQRQGYGSETLGLLLAYLFENTPAYSVDMWFADWNEAARAFARRHGFAEEGALRRAGIFGGRYYDAMAADILRPEWKEKFGEARHAA